jgi:hypothetical protein
MGDTMQIPTMAFDQVGDSWVAVGLGSTNCGKAVGEVWGGIQTATTSRRHPGRGIQPADGDGLRQQTARDFTRTGDVDVNTLPDRATLPPLVVSLAEALRGHRHETDVTPNGYRDQARIQIADQGVQPAIK